MAYYVKIVTICAIKYATSATLGVLLKHIEECGVGTEEAAKSGLSLWSISGRDSDNSELGLFVSVSAQKRGNRPGHRGLRFKFRFSAVEHGH